MTIITDPTAVKIKRALLSVSNKDGIVAFAQKLAAYDVEILSTGGTAKTLQEAGLDIIEVSDFTGFPEIMEGRVKTLHPKIHGGLLAKRGNADHQKAMEENGISDIDMLVVNLYPFVETIQSHADYNTCIENIDIGGPAMIRASAKNSDYVATVTDPQDYEIVLADLEKNQGGISGKLRKRLSATAFSLTATYDSNVSSWLVRQMDEEFGTPRRISFSGTRKQVLRYGENPHQKAALYLVDDSLRPGAARAEQIQGKELSYNNLNDADAAFELVAELDDPAVAIIKHANPCGVAKSNNIADAYGKALLCDPVSAFGGIVAINRTLDLDTAELLTKKFLEVIIAPDVSNEAKTFLESKDKIRVLKTGGMPDMSQHRNQVKRIAGGLLVQDADIKQVSKSDISVVSDRDPTDQEFDDMIFAFLIAKHVKSNAIVYAKNGASVGIGAGQMNRRDSAQIAALKAQEAADLAGLDTSITQGSVVASDAFFPFADGLIAAAEAGVTAVIQPGGSIRDQEVIDAANERGLAMVFTGIRHFKH